MSIFRFVLCSSNRIYIAMLEGIQCQEEGLQTMTARFSPEFIDCNVFSFSTIVDNMNMYTEYVH